VEDVTEELLNGEQDDDAPYPMLDEVMFNDNLASFKAEKRQRRSQRGELWFKDEDSGCWSVFTGLVNRYFLLLYVHLI
jgi:hypothetical protein